MQARASAVRSRAADVRSEALATAQRAEEMCARTVAVLAGFTGRPFGDRNERFLLRVARCRPMVGFVRHDLRRWLERAGLPRETVSKHCSRRSHACVSSVIETRTKPRSSTSQPSWAKRSAPRALKFGTDEDCLAGDDLGDREACLEVVARGPRPSGLELALLVGL
jgi:hypothetical protein